MIDPSTVDLVKALGTPLAVLGAGVGHAVAWYKLTIKKAARDEAEAQYVSTWRVEHQKEADGRDKVIQELQSLIREVVATNKGQDVRIKNLEDESRDNRKANQPNRRLT